MLHWSLMFLVLALIAAILGFGGLAGAAIGIAKVLFFVFLVGATLAYLAIVEITKRIFYRAIAGQSPRGGT